MKELDLVVFDMAGTTIEDSGQVLSAFAGALRGHQIAVTDDDLRRWRGAAKREVLRFFIEQQYGRDDPRNVQRIERAYADFRDRLENSYAGGGVRAIDGAESAFDWLRERGVKIALTTGFYRKVADAILRAVGWHIGVIDVSICNDDVTMGRPAPFMIFRAMESVGVTDVRRVVKVGDTALDLLAGMNAGVRGVVGVLSGSQTVEQLGAVAHTHILSSVAALPALLENAFQSRHSE